MNDFKQAACQAIEEAADELELLSKEIWSNPELNAFSKAACTPMLAATPASAIRLCPQACPISGKASYSQITAILGPKSDDPSSALNAVSTTYFLSTVKPFFSR
jgi:hypothetical protein